MRKKHELLLLSYNSTTRDQFKHKQALALALALGIGHKGVQLLRSTT
jgi:hypothetical protein